MKLSNIHTTRLTLDDGRVFDLEHSDVDEASVQVVDEEFTTKVGYLVPDAHCEHPLERCDGMGRILRTDHPNVRDEIRKIVESGKPHVKLAAYIHSGEHWSIQNSIAHHNYPDQQFDVAHFAGIWVPTKDMLVWLNDPKCETTLERTCQGVLDEYNAWLGGDCWGVCVDTFDKDKLLDDSDSCWGYVGRKCAEESLKEMLGTK